MSNTSVGDSVFMEQESQTTEIQNQFTDETMREEPFALTQSEILFTAHGQQQKIYNDQMMVAEVTWSSSDEKVATVSDGVITAVGRGEATITAFYQGQTHRCYVVSDLPVLPVVNEDADIEDPVYLPPEIEIVDDAFFDDALFIGDSQGWSFYKWVQYYGYLGDALHMTRNGYSVDSAANDRMLLSWRGKNYVIEEAIARTGAKRVFLMLGINDVGHYELSDIHLIMDNWQIILDRIKERNPDVQICIQSIPPVVDAGQTEDVNNEKVGLYNEFLKIIAQENECVFIDVGQYFMDAAGGMAMCYCSDEFVHVNEAGVDTWVKVLKACTDYE